MDTLKISENVEIPMSEIEISFTRSGGPGGQHVNKTATQVELSFDLMASSAFTEEDKRWLATRLASRLDSAGVLRVTSQESRSQLQNRKRAYGKLAELLSHALRRPKRRRPTRPTKASKERRLESKKKRSDVKQGRRAQF